MRACPPRGAVPAQALADTRRHIACARAALAAAVHHAPELGQEASRLHVQLLDLEAAVIELERAK